MDVQESLVRSDAGTLGTSLQVLPCSTGGAASPPLSSSDDVCELMGGLQKSFQDLRGRMHEHHKEVVQRRYYTVNGSELEDEQAEEMIESGESEEIFKKAKGTHVLSEEQQGWVDTQVMLQQIKIPVPIEPPDVGCGCLRIGCVWAT